MSAALPGAWYGFSLISSSYPIPGARMKHPAERARNLSLSSLPAPPLGYDGGCGQAVLSKRRSHRNDDPVRRASSFCRVRARTDHRTGSRRGMVFVRDANRGRDRLSISSLEDRRDAGAPIGPCDSLFGGRLLKSHDPFPAAAFRQHAGKYNTTPLGLLDSIAADC